MTPQIRIWWDAQIQSYRVVTPYNDKFIESLKQLIPISERVWDKPSKTWTVTERAMPIIKDLAEKAFGVKATVISRQQAETSSQPASIKVATTDAVILEFFKLLPFEAAQKAYRHAAMMLHPDRGGDMEKMSRFNAAWQRLEKEIYGRG